MGQVTEWLGCAAKERKAIMEADTACIPSSDLPVRVSCLFRHKQIVSHEELIGCARYSNSVSPV